MPKKKTSKTPSAPAVDRAALCSGFTDAELNEFRDLVEKGESLQQLDRIESRLEMPKFIERVGREKCDAMFEVLKRELR
jgi:hypothetical protein